MYSLTVSVSTTKTQVKYSLHNYLYSFKYKNEIDYSPFNSTEHLNEKDLKVYAGQVVTAKKLTKNDTIAVSIANLIFE